MKGISPSFGHRCIWVYADKILWSKVQVTAEQITVVDSPSSSMIVYIGMGY